MLKKKKIKEIVIDWCGFQIFKRRSSNDHLLIMDWDVLWEMCFANMTVTNQFFLWSADGVSHVDMLGLRWVALILTVTMVVTWKPSKTLTLIKSLSLAHTYIDLPFLHIFRHSHAPFEPLQVISRPFMRQSIRKLYLTMVHYTRFSKKNGVKRKWCQMNMNLTISIFCIVPPSHTFCFLPHCLAVNE